MGGWAEHKSIFDNKDKRRWIKGYPLAYLKFIGFSIKDYFNGYKN